MKDDPKKTYTKGIVPERMVRGDSLDNEGLSTLVDRVCNLGAGTLALIFIAITYLALKFAGYLFVVDDGKTVTLAVTSYSTPFAVLAVSGFLIGYLALLMYGLWGEPHAKTVVGGVLGAVFATNLCTSGVCIPGATFLTLFSAVALIPVGVGAGLARMLLSSVVSKKT